MGESDPAFRPVNLPPKEASKRCRASIAIAQDALQRALHGLFVAEPDASDWTYIGAQLDRAQQACCDAGVIADQVDTEVSDREFVDTPLVQIIHADPFIPGPIDIGGEGGVA